MPLGAPGLIVLLRGLRGPRLRQRPRAHRGGLPDRPAPAGAAALPRRRLRALAARRQAGVPRPPGLPGEDLAASGSRSARSRTRCCGCPASATARWWSPSGRTRASSWWPSTPAREPLDVEVLRGRLGASLPHYMVPAAFHWRESAAADRQRQDRHEGAGRARRRARRPSRTGRASRRRRRPSSGSPPRGRRCSACRQDQIGRHDHFFDRGGTSLSAVKLAIALDRGGSRSRTSPATRCSPTWPSCSTAAARGRQSRRPSR